MRYDIIEPEELEVCMAPSSGRNGINAGSWFRKAKHGPALFFSKIH